MDTQICTDLYKTPSPFNFSEYLNAGAIGFLNGALEKSLASFLMHVECLSLDEHKAADLALLSTTLIRLAQQNSLFNPATCLIALAFFAAREPGNPKLQWIQSIANLFSLLMTFYTVYAEEEAFNTSLYLGAMLVATISGSMLGREIGETAATMANGLNRSLKLKRNPIALI